MSNKSHNVEVEIESSYLPRQLPQSLLTTSPTRITDIYLSPEGDLLTKLRLRQKGEKYELTKKVNVDPNNLSIQNEYTIPLTKDEFNMLRLADGREITKDRYEIALNEHTMEIDVFRDRLEGLIIIEMEFNSLDERDMFTPPEYFGPDVTQEDFIAGAYLAGKSYKDIKPTIARLM